MWENDRQNNEWKDTVLKILTGDQYMLKPVVKDTVRAYVNRSK